MSRLITGFIFWLIAFNSGFMVKTASRNPHNCPPIQVPYSFPEYPLWKNYSICLKCISTLSKAICRPFPVALLQKNVPVFFPSNFPRGSQPRRESPYDLLFFTIYYFQRCSQLLSPKQENKGH